MDGTGVQVLTSHHCGPGLIPGSGVYCWYLSLLQGKKLPISPGNNGKEVPPWWNIFCIIYIIIITITQKAHSFVAGMLMLQYQPYINLQCP